MKSTTTRSPSSSANVKKKDDAESRVEAVLARHSGALRGFLIRALKPDEDIDDVLQEVCLRLLRREHEGGADSDYPKAYVFVIATNIIRDMRRKGAVRTRARTDPVFATAVNSELVDPEPSVEDALLWREGLDIVHEALRSLDPKYARVFLLRWRDGLTFPQISKHTNTPIRTVERYASHALAHCKCALERRNWKL